MFDKSLDLLPHFAVGRGFYSWDFATQGLCIMHFLCLTDTERRKRRSDCDMSDFSRNNKLPLEPTATDITAISDALGGLAAKKRRNSCRNYLGHNRADISVFKTLVMNYLTELTNDLNVFG
ncbi:Hypothetical protein PHPALM_9012 [Phytophthora palmivora]|uniref:Uncharacterized protein n=1 Tax=Phytophthora palmivora TaxID=4796 RepID=A0A2P4Y8E6_9STRA|nr:Hypothetical protein PHPALM_9012 [Phytophthora palmivora]